MAATEHDRCERRRFITRHDIEDAAASSQPIRLHGRDVITSEAAQRAADLGVQIERDQPAGKTFRFSTKTSPAAPPSTAAAPAASDADLRRAVDLGVQIERDQPAGMTSRFSTKTPSAPPSTAAAPAASDADLRRAVRAAVVAELGSEASGLDLAIDKVLKARSR